MQGQGEKVSTIFFSGFQQHPHSLHVDPRQLWSSVHADAGWIHLILSSSLNSTQALMMLMVEKVSVFFPRMCQKLERFSNRNVDKTWPKKFKPPIDE